MIALGIVNREQMKTYHMATGKPLMIDYIYIAP